SHVSKSELDSDINFWSESIEVNRRTRPPPSHHDSSPRQSSCSGGRCCPRTDPATAAAEFLWPSEPWPPTGYGSEESSCHDSHDYACNGDGDGHRHPQYGYYCRNSSPSPFAAAG
ncbi:hypothetical protein THAOC_14771, partial [Thalassiosira oceanica]